MTVLKRFHYLLIFTFICCFRLQAFETVYTYQDSLTIVSLLAESENLSTEENKVLFFAEYFKGLPYKGSTLEKKGKEALIINLREMDCTTFVETVFALTLASKTEQKSFQDFVSALCKIRYRNGILDGYPSRLHYTSEWIEDNIEKNILKDVTSKISDDVLSLSINFMSSHPDSYHQLKNNPRNLKSIQKTEAYLTGKRVFYIPKEKIGTIDNITEIKSGNIVVFTTDIKGLDVSHMGFVIRSNGRLHLLHASSLHKKIVVDPLPLKEYVLNGKRITGVRILSIL